MYYDPKEFLHTGSGWAHDIRAIGALPINNEAQLRASIKGLEARELAAYRKYFPDCKSYEDFRNKLQETFKDSPQSKNDAHFIQLFSNQNIKKFLISIIGTQEKGDKLEQNVSIVWNFETMPLIVNLDSFITGKSEISINNKQISLNLKGNINDIKKTINNIIGKQRFKANTDSVQALNNFLKSQEFQTAFCEKINSSPNALTLQASTGKLQAPSVRKFKDVYKSDSKKRTLFSYQASDLKKEDIIYISNEIQEAADELKERIMAEGNYQNCSKSLQESFENIWNGKISSKLIISSFAKGNTISSIVGSMGELQFALINDYLLSRLDIQSPILKSMLSDTLKKGEQAKVDVTILKDVGIQVKNFNINAEKTWGDTKHFDISGNTHFRKIMEYKRFSENVDKKELVSFLANYFFNLDFQKYRVNQMKKLELKLQDFFGEIINLALEDSLTDVVTFYYIGGSYLVPGSIILKQAFDKRNTFVTQVPKISSSFQGKTDEQWKEDKEKRKEYWLGGPGHWEPGSKNTDSTIENLGLDQTTIRVSFDYHSLEQGLEYYSIF